MKVIIGPRATGKTTKLIEIAAEGFYYIVCRTKEHSGLIFQEAKRMELDIPFPITFDEFRNGRFHGKGIRGFVIDDAEVLLQYLAGSVPVKAVSLFDGFDKRT